MSRTTLAWVLLIVAGLLEIVWALALKQADGMTRLWPTIIGVSVAMASLALLTVALRDLPIGIAYAAWMGIGTVGVTVAGMTAFGEHAAPGKLVFLALIMVGIVGLRLAES